MYLMLLHRNYLITIVVSPRATTSKGGECQVGVLRSGKLREPEAGRLLQAGD